MNVEAGFLIERNDNQIVEDKRISRALILVELEGCQDNFVYVTLNRGRRQNRLFTAFFRDCA